MDSSDPDADSNVCKLVAATPSNGPRATKQPRAILAEEEYNSTLTHIVTRDYFPSLHSLRRDALILEARSRGDVAGAVAVRRMARKEESERERELKDEVEQEREAVAETSLVPHSGINSARISVRKRPRALRHESITGFHARVTSEDNAEFETNQEQERRDRETNLGIIFAARADKGGRLMIESCLNGSGGADDEKGSPPNKKPRALLGDDTPLGLSSDLYDAPPSSGMRITERNDAACAQKADSGSGGIGRNGLFFPPIHYADNAQSNKGSGNEKNPSGGMFLENSQPIIDNKELGDIQCDNLLMPPPPKRLPISSGMVPLNQPNDQSTEDSSAIGSVPSIHNRSQLVEYLPKPVSDINPPATRFPYQNESRLLPNSTDSIVRFCDIGSSAETSDTTDLDSSPPPLNLERTMHQKARRREHETFVAMTPLIKPGEGVSDGRTQGDKTAAESSEPIMTWGDVASTPLVLGNGAAVDGCSSSLEWEPTRPASILGNADEGNSVGPVFDVVDRSSRESLARRAERGLLDRARTYRSAGSSVVDKRETDRDDESVCSSRSKSILKAPLERVASLTPAARALLEATNNARQAKNKTDPSLRMFKSTPLRSGRIGVETSAASSHSFGSALRLSYTPNTTPRRRKGTSGKRDGSSSLSSLRRAAGGATPRCRSLR